MLETTLQFEREAEWERAAKLLDLDPAIARALLHPQMECVSHHECWSDTPASLYVVASELSAAPTIASLRVGEHVELSQLREAAQQLRLQAALASADAAAAAIGVRLPSSEICERDLWDLARECAPMVRRLFTRVQPLANDVRGAAFANWMELVPAIAPEKYCQRLSETLSQAMHAAARCALEQQGRVLREAGVVVLGMAPLSLAAIARLHEAGARIVGVADESGAIHHDKGLELPLLLDHARSGGLVAEFAGGEHVTHTEIIAVPADILLLDAATPELTANNAHRLHAPIVLQGPASGLSAELCEELEERDKIIVPHWLLESARLAPEPGFFQPLWQDLARLQERWHVPLRTAALLLALDRLDERAQARRPF